jgi:hypothetical protein
MIEIIRQKPRLFPSLKNFERNLLILGIYSRILMLEKCWLSGTYPKFKTIFQTHFTFFKQYIGL